MTCVAVYSVQNENSGEAAKGGFICSNCNIRLLIPFNSIGLKISFIRFVCGWV